MENYIIRFATPQDIDTIIDLCEAHAIFEKCDYSRDGKKERLAGQLFAESPVIKCILLITAEGISGYATYRPEYSTWDAGYFMHMDCLYLVPAARGKGFGKKIVQHIIAEAKQAGYCELQWQTPIDNYDAIGFYKKLGAGARELLRFFLPY